MKITVRYKNGRVAKYFSKEIEVGHLWSKMKINEYIEDQMKGFFFWYRTDVLE